ncbi:MAG: alpha/beta hydrolase [Pseudomonadota bacterium]|jgi:pimeloyl-ACP methyl ester carboxylesterase
MEVVHTPHPALTSPLIWRQVGAGRPLVMLHGGHGSWAHWVRNMEALAHTHTVVSVDMPMYGDSGDLAGSLKGEPALGTMLGVLKDCIEARFGVGTEIDLAGFSFGGMVAAKLHRLLNTRRMVLIGSAGHGGKWRRFVELRKWEVSDPAEREAALRHNIVPFMLEHAASMDEQAYLIHKYACENTRYKSRPVSLTLSIDEDLRSSPSPTLMLWGEHDVTCTPAQVAPAWVRLMPKAEWREVPAAGHWAQYENPAWVNQAMQAWLT